MNEFLKEVVKNMPKLQQRQDGSKVQLQDLRVIANKLGMYDAADVIRILLEPVKA